MNTRRGISPVLATVIIIAVTLVIAIGVIGWIMGIWRGFGTTESLQPYPDSYITGTTLYLHLKNTGTATAVIYKVEIVGLDTISSSPSITSLTPGQEATVTITLTSTASSGTQYTVRIYTTAGNVYTTQVRAE